MFEAKAVVQNEAGIHCRPSAVLVKEASAFNGAIEISAASGSCSLASVLELMILGLEKGEEVSIRVEGPDERAFGARLVELFETRFDFPAATADPSAAQGACRATAQAHR